MNFTQVMESTSHGFQQKEDARGYLDHLNKTGDLITDPPSFVLVGVADRTQMWRGMSATHTSLRQKAVALRRELGERLRDSQKKAEIEERRQRALEISLRDRRAALDRQAEALRNQRTAWARLIREEQQIESEGRKILARIGVYATFYRACADYRDFTGRNPFRSTEGGNSSSEPPASTGPADPFRSAERPKAGGGAMEKRTDGGPKNPFSQP